MTESALENLLRQLAPQVLGAVVRRYGHFDTAEDATQEALLAAAQQWPRDGQPDNPRGWLITVASRRLTDLLRSEQSRRQREHTVSQWALPDQRHASAADTPPSYQDDTLILLFLGCHPSLSPSSQIALTLKAVGGLSTAEIARAFLVPEATMTRRVTRAKKTIKESGVPFRLPPPAERTPRLEAVLHVLYLIFNEGYAATSGQSLQRSDLAGEAIRLTRLVRKALPTDSEVTGLLALMLLTDARRRARTAADGTPIPMAEQDRTLWDSDMVTEGLALIKAALPQGPTGPYQLQATVAALHDEAASDTETDWPQILAVYELLLQIADNPVVALNHAVAVAMTHGPEAGLKQLDRLVAEGRVVQDHRLPMVRAHLLELTGDRSGAQSNYAEAAQRATSLPQQRYLHARAVALDP